MSVRQSYEEDNRPSLDAGKNALSLPENQFAIRRAMLGLARNLNWGCINEFSLPAAGRRADIMALTPDGMLHCIEIKSGSRDFLTDRKWPEYRAWCDRLYFAVDQHFPRNLIPDDVGLFVAHVMESPSTILPECAMIRESPLAKLAAARRKTLMQLFGHNAALRLMALEDPAMTASLRAARRVE
ncbi:MmcB family DNA repair protein [Asaia prunellae]|uniref:MmcB family DNA repair protein n=1 Tax=Asaia prunellae TaxID=610245 RepID=UPI001FB0A59F|nr:MmcB family DNA repair protein [Asaia prunellae]